MDIFTTLTGLIASMDSCAKGTAKQLLYPILPKFTEAMVEALQVPDGFSSDSGLKMEILKVEIVEYIFVLLIKSCNIILQVFFFRPSQY